MTSSQAGYCGSHFPSLSSDRQLLRGLEVQDGDGRERLRDAANLEKSAGVIFAPAFRYFIVPVARLMFCSAPFGMMLRDAAEMCSGSARVATYVSSAFRREAVRAASRDWAAAGDHVLSAIKTATPDRYMRSPPLAAG